MSPPRNAKPRMAAGLGQIKSTTAITKRTAGRPEFQGNRRNARNADQRPPQWDEPSESDAMRLLERLWGRS